MLITDQVLRLERGPGTLPRALAHD